MHLEWIICETNIETSKSVTARSSRFTSTKFDNKPLHLSICKTGHFSQTAFACDPESHCLHYVHQMTCRVLGGGLNHTDLDVNVELFPCEESGHTIQYSMIS